MVMALACLAPVAALALVDSATDDEDLTAAGQPSAPTGVAAPVATSSSAPLTTLPPAPTTAGPTSTAPPPATDSPTTTAAPTTTSPPTTAPTTTTTTTPSQAAEAEVLALVNAERSAKPACRPLAVDQRLATAAQGHSDDMAERDYFAHTSPDGTTAEERARAAGFPEPVGENIAHGYSSAEDVMAAWMDSDGHAANILNCYYTVIGVGLNDDGWYWTQLFG
jgi:uncharacterized protein YkwD